MTKEDEEKDDIETGGEAETTDVKNVKNDDNAKSCNNNKLGTDGEKKIDKTEKQQDKKKDEEGPSAINVDEDGGVTATIGSVNIRINQMRLPLVGMLVSSCVLLISIVSLKGITIWRSEVWKGYAIAYPCVTLAVSFFALLMTGKASFFKSNGKYLYVFLFIWNFIGACLVTFINPFTTTGNGYFSAWMTVLCALGGLGIRGDSFASAIHGLGCIMGLISSSIIVIIALTDYFGKESLYRAESIYAMLVSCFTLVVFLAYIVDQKRRGGGDTGSTHNIFQSIMLSIFALLWVALAGITTFRGPFLSTSNGYFASWMGAACACYAVTATQNQEKKQ
mmetsp:Transcript_50215/g.56094  ORF Transcript_50215/g.56094 Transcript_50215/m.56094 type:complete len:335 (+) Transcript_50215:107-1111(+)